MKRRKGKIVTIVAGVGVLALALLLGVYWEEIAVWIKFVRTFEDIGTNEQGYPEYRHRETGIVMVRVPAGTFWMGTSQEEGEGEGTTSGLHSGAEQDAVSAVHRRGSGWISGGEGNMACVEPVDLSNKLRLQHSAVGLGVSDEASVSAAHRGRVGRGRDGGKREMNLGKDEE